MFDLHPARELFEDLELLVERDRAGFVSFRIFFGLETLEEAGGEFINDLVQVFRFGRHIMNPSYGL